MLVQETKKYRLKIWKSLALKGSTFQNFRTIRTNFVKKVNSVQFQGSARKRGLGRHPGQDALPLHGEHAARRGRRRGGAAPRQREDRSGQGGREAGQTAAVMMTDDDDKSCT